jgi:hypothetical protein
MIRSVGFLLVCGILRTSPLSAQQDTPPQSKLLNGISSAEVKAIQESRRKADQELFSNHDYDPPEIASSLGDPDCLIAIARVTSVAAEENPVSPGLNVELEIEQLLRGSSDKTHIYVVSRWRPPPPPGSGVYVLGRLPNALDRTEPKVGNRYLIGYNLDMLGYQGTKAWFRGGMDFNVSDQTRTLAEVRHFLDIESDAGASDLSPFITALNDPIHWIRDLVAQRLANSDACHSSSACGDALLSHAHELLHSKTARERYEGLQWLQPLVAATRKHRAGSSMDNDTLRDLLVSAISDPNVRIGDRAFEDLAVRDFYRNATPGQCLEVIAPLRRSAVWNYDESKNGFTGTPLGDSTSCNAPDPTSQTR